MLSGCNEFKREMCVCCITEPIVLQYYSASRATSIFTTIATTTTTLTTPSIATATAATTCI